jgi:hypothetical protein
LKNQNINRRVKGSLEKPLNDGRIMLLHTSTLNNINNYHHRHIGSFSDLPVAASNTGVNSPGSLK